MYAPQHADDSDRVDEPLGKITIANEIFVCIYRHIDSVAW